MSRESDYDAEVAYQVWRRGGNPDLVDRDRTADHYDSGCTEDEAAAYELRRQRGRSEHGDEHAGT